MKNKIKDLIKSEKGCIRINPFCMVQRSKTDIYGNACDVLQVVIQIGNSYQHISEIRSRKYSDIVEEIKEAHKRAFDQIHNELLDQLEEN